MKVLQVMGSSSGGVAAHVTQAAGLLADAGHRVIVAAPSQIEGARWAHVSIGRRPSPRDPAAVARLRPLVRGADIVHAHGLRAGALAVVACTGLSVRPHVVVTLHNRPVGGWNTRAMGAGLLALVARGADQVLAVSPDLADDARQAGAQRVRLALIPPPAAPPSGIDVPPAHRDDLAANPAVVLTVARLARQKGLDLACDAAGRLRHLLGPQGPEFDWLIAGEGPLRERIALRAADEGLPLRLLGRRDDLPSLYARATVVVSTAEWEGQPIGLQEALRAGCAIVATDVGGTGHTLGSGAQLVPRDAETIASAIARLLTDGEALAAAQAAARQRAAELPGPEQLLAQLLAAYDAATPSPSDVPVG